MLLDACVLYPAPLRDLLMHLAVADVFHARWSDAIHDEWIGSLLAKRPDLRRDQLERTRRLMNLHVRDCLVTGYEHLIDGLALPDSSDRHVLAAAIKAGAQVILTFNLAHFPDAALAPFGIQAKHPDEELVQQFAASPAAVYAAARRQRESLRNPPKSVDAYLATLAAQGLEQTVAQLQAMPALL